MKAIHVVCETCDKSKIGVTVPGDLKTTPLEILTCPDCQQLFTVTELSLNE